MNIDGDSNQLPTWRLWGEERTDGAVYAVYLKKVRYHVPSKAISDSEDDISHLEWETVRVRLIKAGTLEKLVESLASDTGELESTYVNVFLATYRCFSTADQVLELISKRYADLNKPTVLESVRLQHKKTLRSTLHVWLDAFPEDFRDPPDYQLLNQFLDFCERQAKDTELHFKVKHRMERLIKNPENHLSSLPILDRSSPSSKRILNHHNSELSFSPDAASSPAGLLKNGRSSSLGNGLSLSLCPADLNESGLHAAFLEMSERLMAEQLTRFDTELFKRVIPHQCLGAVWSRREKIGSGVRGGSRMTEAWTVAATVEQFNAVSYRVISTILLGGSLLLRARIAAKWIDVAQELRVLKNFSSLKAIISALQSNPIYRLKHIWANIPKEKVEVYEELARIFSEENNQSAQRELLMKEGTAKFAETAGENDKQMQKVIQKQASHSNLISHGTIPYLGTFLTDLTMIDTAIPDMTSEGLINFDKRRKEFEILAQIKLLQGAANSYQIVADPRFERWFESLTVLDEQEAHEQSCNLEPISGSGGGVNSARNSDKFQRRKPVSAHHMGHRKNDSIASTSSSSSSQFLSELDSSNPANTAHHSAGAASAETASLEQKMFSTHLSSSSSSSSLPSLDVSVSSSGAQSQATPGNSSKAGSLPRGITPPYSVSPMRTPDFYVIRVSISTSCKETEGINLYKSIMVSNHERSPQVIRNAMAKHGLEGNPEDFTLSQILPKGVEMVLPPNANVYYAINTSCDLNFVLRPKSDSSLSSAQSSPGSASIGPIVGRSSGASSGTPGRPRLREASGTKEALKARKKILSLGL